MQQTIKRHLIAAVRMMLKPLVRLLISQGVTHTDLSQAAKDVFVEVAIRHFMEHQKINQSRIAVITGLTRKEVKRVLDNARQSEEQDAGFSRPGRILTAWHTDPKFIGPYGLPLDLPYDSESPDVSSFKSLVKTYGADNSAKIMLDVLLSSGSVTTLDNGLLRPVRRSFEPSALSAELIERFGFVAHDFLSTAAHNIEAPSEGKFMERVVRADRALSPKALTVLSGFMKENSQTLLEKVDNQMVSLKDPGSGDDKVMTGMGVYQYIELPEDKQSLKQLLIERSFDAEE